MSEENKIEIPRPIKDVIRTGSADSQGVYSTGGGYAQFENAVEGPAGEPGSPDLPKVGIYQEPGAPAVVEITPDPLAVFRGPNDPKPQDALRSLPLRKITDPNELKQ